jgi:hypothetical protein
VEKLLSYKNKVSCGTVKYTKEEKWPAIGFGEHINGFGNQEK